MDIDFWFLASFVSIKGITKAIPDTKSSSVIALNKNNRLLKNNRGSEPKESSLKDASSSGETRGMAQVTVDTEGGTLRVIEIRSG